MSVPAKTTTPTAEEDEARLAAIAAELTQNEADHDRLLEERKVVARRLKDVHGRQLATIGRLAGVSGSAIAFQLDLYQRSARRRS